MCRDELHDLYWRYSYSEMITRLEIKMGETSAIQLCHFSSFAQVASLALGGRKPKFEETKVSSPEEAVAMLNSLLTIG